MTAADRIYELIQSLPAEQVNAILDYAEFLHQKQLTQSPASAPVTIPPGALTGLRGVAKLPLAERHQILAQSIAATAHDFLTDPELTEFADLDMEDWELEHG